MWDLDPWNQISRGLRTSLDLVLLDIKPLWIFLKTCCLRENGKTMSCSCIYVSVAVFRLYMVCIYVPVAVYLHAHGHVFMVTNPGLCPMCMWPCIRMYVAMFPHIYLRCLAKTISPPLHSSPFSLLKEEIEYCTCHHIFILQLTLCKFLASQNLTNMVPMDLTNRASYVSNSSVNYSTHVSALFFT